MPIYEYKCEACGHYLDALQKLADEPLKECPECNTASLRRLISAPSFRLKGAGWYETDFKSDKERKRNLAERAAEKGEEPAKSSQDSKSSPEPSSKSESEGSGAKGADAKRAAKASSETKKTPSKKGTGSEAA